MTRLTNRLAPWAPTVLRVTLGVIMAVHGWQKLTAMTPAGFGNGMLDGLGVPAPVAMAWVVTLVELVGGIALVLGLASRIAAAANGLVLAGATLLVKTDLGLVAEMGSPLPGAELDLALIALSIGVVALGPGRLAIDRSTGLDDTEVSVAHDVNDEVPVTA